MSDQLQDKTIECRDCHAPFVWTAGEQEHYASKGLMPPKRCKACRVVKRQRFAEENGQQQAAGIQPHVRREFAAPPAPPLDDSFDPFSGPVPRRHGYDEDGGGRGGGRRGRR